MNDRRNDTPKHHPMHLFAVVTLGLLLTALLSGCELAAEPVKQQAPQPFTATERGEARRAHVFRVPAAQRSETERFVARVAAAQAIDLAFEVSGTLVELPVREGQTIPKGELIARLNQTDFKLAREEAQVALRVRRNDHARKASLLAKRGISQSAVDDAWAAVELAQVRLKQAQETLRETSLLAPFDAYVAGRRVDNHSNIQGATPVVRLFDLSKLHLVAEVPEALLATMSQDDVSGAVARFSFLADQEFPISYLEQSGEAGRVAQTYAVKFELDPPEGVNLLPGMTATVHLERQNTASPERAFEIPSSALATSPDNALGVWVLNEQTNEVHWQAVAAEAATAGKFRITDGLKGEELIVTTGVALLRDNMTITPIADRPRT